MKLSLFFFSVLLEYFLLQRLNNRPVGAILLMVIFLLIQIGMITSETKKTQYYRN